MKAPSLDELVLLPEPLALQRHFDAKNYRISRWHTPRGCPASRSQSLSTDQVDSDAEEVVSKTLAELIASQSLRGRVTSRRKGLMVKRPRGILYGEAREGRAAAETTPDVGAFPIDGLRWFAENDAKIREITPLAEEIGSTQRYGDSTYNSNATFCRLLAAV